MKLQDVIHFYLGCQCETAYGIGKLERIDELGLVKIRFTDATMSSKHLGLVQIKPILRRMNSFTEDEYAHMEGNFPIIDMDRNLSDAEKEARKLQYLLSLNIDLFGLIDSGEAIEKVKI